jgi:hypothetical protein
MAILFLACLLPASFALHERSSSASSTRRLESLPQTILWAWERPEDLRFLPAGQVGVSFLAATLTLSAGSVRVQPRRNALQLTPGTPLVACARIEVDSKRSPTLSSHQASAASAAIGNLANLAGIGAVQVDFDATVSERTFYADLLRDLRRRLPPDMPLSITALASWCMDDTWIAGLPVDEAVPMLFRMGPDAADVRVLLAQRRDFSLPVCRESIGISTDEKLAALPAGRRRYVFGPEGWSPGAVRALIAEAKP